MKLNAQILVIVSLGLSTFGCVHRYTDRSYSFDVPTQDAPTLLAIIQSLYSPATGTCVEVTKSELQKNAKKFEMHNGSGPRRGAKVYCFEKHAENHPDYSGIAACVYNRDSQLTRIEIVASVNDKCFFIPEVPQETLDGAMRYYTEIKNTAEASGASLKNIQPAPYYATDRICGDY